MGVVCSVVVPFCRAEVHLDACIQALLDQDLPAERYEILLIDNNSRDGSRAIAARYPRVTLLSESRPGPYAARNHGVAASKGAILAFTDADCAPSPHWLSRLLACLRDEPVDLVLGRPLPCRSKLLRLIEAYESERATFVYGGAERALYYGYTSNMAVRRRLFDAAGPFYEIGRGADMIFVHRALDRVPIGAVRYLPDATVRHLEMTSVWVWLKKMFIYGRSTHHYRPIVPARALTPREGFEVLRRAGVRHGFSPVQRAVLLVLLGLGVLAHRAGRLCGGMPADAFLNATEERRG